MELEYSISIKGNCQLARMKVYKKWMKASRKWERILPHTIRYTMHTCEGRDTWEWKRTNCQKSFVQWIFCFSRKFIPIFLLSILYISLYMYGCMYIRIYTCMSVYLYTHISLYSKHFGDMTKSPFKECHVLRKFNFWPCSWLPLSITLSAIIL